MGDKQELIYSFRAALRIIETTLSGKVPFKVVDIYEDEKSPYANIDIEGERFMTLPDTTGNKLWIPKLKVENISETGLESGFAGFPSEVAGAIQRHCSEKPRGPFQTLTGIGDLGKVSLNEIVKEEIKKIFVNESLEEVEISTALSFMQDTRGSIEKLGVQKNLETTNEEVDNHLSRAIEHMDKAIRAYFTDLSPEVKNKVLRRLGEIEI